MRSLLLQLILLVAWIGVQGTSAKGYGGALRGLGKLKTKTSAFKIPLKGLTPGLPSPKFKSPQPIAVLEKPFSWKNLLPNTDNVKALIEGGIHQLLPSNAANDDVYSQRLDRLELAVESLNRKIDDANSPETITKVVEPSGLPLIQQKLKDVEDLYQQALQAQIKLPQVPKEKIDKIVTGYDKALDGLVAKKELLKEANVVGSVLAQIKLTEDVDVWSWTELHKRRSIRSANSAKERPAAIVRRIQKAIRALKS